MSNDKAVKKPVKYCDRWMNEQRLALFYIGFYCSKKIVWTLLSSLLYMLIASIGTTALAGSLEPVKIKVQTKVQSTSEGKFAPVEIVLKDANNNNVTAPKEFTFNVEVWSQQGVTETQKISMKAGEGIKTINVPLKKAGIVEIRASQKELLGGSTFIRVMPIKSTSQSFYPTTMPQVKKSAPRMTLPEKSISTPDENNALLRTKEVEADRKSDSQEVWTGTGVKSQASENKALSTKNYYTMRDLQQKEASLQKAARPEPPPVPAPTPLPFQSLPPDRVSPTGFIPGVISSKKITIRQSPMRPLRADGNDAATIYAFLVGDESVAQREISVRLFNSKGNLIPKPLIIPMGAGSGSSTLTSTEVGEITVEYLDSTPIVALEGEQKIAIPFEPPVTSIEIRASPPAISLEDNVDLVVRLLDNNGKVIATNKPLTISFTIDKGRGKLQHDSMTIPAGNYECRTQFSPTTTGPVEISASTPNILSKSVPIEVTFPIMLTLLSILGGLVGGLIKLLTTQKRKKDFNQWTVLFGIVTGPLLYWAVTFGTVSLFPVINALNLFSALFISVIGGWLGTSVFSLILKKKP